MAVRIPGAMVKEALVDSGSLVNNEDVDNNSLYTQPEDVSTLVKYAMRYRG